MNMICLLDKIQTSAMEIADDWAALSLKLLALPQIGSKRSHAN
jgi:hypothetical protein